MRTLALATAVVALLFGGFVLLYTTLSTRPATAQTGPIPLMEPTPRAGPMSGMGPGGPMVPPVKGYTEGREIRFLHTEASDPTVAEMLTTMMDSPVLLVPSLAQAPESMLANVYVFTNGITGDGPFGFQPDVFDNPPGTDGYSPLRAVNLVSWNEQAAARELTSVAEVQHALAAGLITIERPGAVVNMPMVTWPGGQR